MYKFYLICPERQKSMAGSYGVLRQKPQYASAALQIMVAGRTPQPNTYYPASHGKFGFHELAKDTARNINP
jgi:hypothetical protein